MLLSLMICYVDVNARDLSTLNRELYLNYARQVGENICDLAENVGENEYRWLSTAWDSETFYSTDIYNGASGIALFLINLYEFTGNNKYCHYAEGAANWLINYQGPDSEKSSGLYVGEAGEGYLFWRMWEVTRDTTYLNWAYRRAQWIAEREFTYTDIIYGAAGTGIFLLEMYYSTGDEFFLEQSRRAGDFLIQHAAAEGEGYKWTLGVSSDYCDKFYLGFSHGTAGIGYFLIELFRATHEEKYLQYAHGAAQWLIDMAVEDDGGLKWIRREPDRTDFAFQWCHGSPGIGLFFIRFYDITKDTTYLEIAQKAAIATENHPRIRDNPCQCHGVGGNAELFIEIYRVTADSSYLKKAENFAEIEETYKVERDGKIFWPSHVLSIFTPDYMVGSAGVGQFFLRMTEPEKVFMPLMVKLPITHTPLFDTENQLYPYTVIASVRGDISSLIGMSILCRFRGAANFSEVAMDLVTPRQYTGEIPAARDTSTIEYYLEARFPDFSWYSPPGAPTRLHSFYVGPDVIAPIISHKPPVNTFSGEQPFYVLVSITDNLGVDTSLVHVHYEVKGLSDSVRLSSLNEGTDFEGYIPPVSAYGDTVSYYFTARDTATVPNTTTSETYQFIVGVEDFESGLAYWTVSPPGWGFESIYAHSGKSSINDSPGQNYMNNTNTAIATNFGFDLSGTNKAVLYFWTKNFLEIGNDYGYVEVSTDSGKNWEQLGETINGVSVQWKQLECSLSPYCGVGFTDVRIRFRMVSDSHQGPSFQGWFVDDVRVVEGAEVSIETSESSDNIPTSFTLSQNYPNPFNPTTTIKFDLPLSSHVTLVIYNLIGQKVVTLVDRNMEAGYGKELRFDASDIPSGIYFCKLTAGDFTATKKMVVMK